MTSTPGVFDNLDSIELPHDKVVVLTVGTFDGVHMAHQALIGEAVKRAREAEGVAAVLTFRNHPRSVVAPDACPPLLTGWEDKRCLLLDLGVDVLVGLEFNRELAEIAAEDFLRRIVAGKLRARIVLCGPAFHFGKGARGHADLIERMAPELEFEFFCREPVMYLGEKVSSTRIRAAVQQGDVELARELLTRPHRNAGRVVTGDRLGRTIGFPTANMEVDGRILVPGDGVYAVRAALPSGELCPGMMNIGWRPTVGGGEHRKEVHLIDFEGELEGQRLQVEYVARLRGEQKFDGLEELKIQLGRDRDAALRALCV